MIRVAVRSVIGATKKQHEDSYFVDADNCIFIVADGFYGDGLGKVASLAAVQIIGSHILELKERSPSGQRNVDNISISDTFHNAFEKAHTEVVGLKALGTTVVAVYVAADKVYIAYAGDSRAYLIRRKNIELLTQDHSLVGAAVKLGAITAEEARKSQHKDILTRALGRMNYHPDLRTLRREPRDYFLLTTDGLTEVLSAGEIRDIIGSSNELDQACDRLVQSAVKKNATDDITTILFCL